MSKGLYMNVSVSSIQLANKVTKAKSKLSYYSHLPKICHWWKMPLPWEAALRGVPAQGEIAAMLHSRESSKKAHLGCHIYGIKWLAHSQVTCHGKGVEMPCTHNLLCSLVKVLEKPPTIHVLITWSVFQAHMHRCSLCQSAPLWVFREQIDTRGVLVPATGSGLYLLQSLHQTTTDLVKGSNALLAQLPRSHQVIDVLHCFSKATSRLFFLETFLVHNCHQI